MYFVFRDLKKMYNTALRDEIWRSMNGRGIPEKCIRLVVNMFVGVSTNVITSVGMTKRLLVSVGLYQEST